MLIHLSFFSHAFLKIYIFFDVTFIIVFGIFPTLLASFVAREVA